MASAPSRGREEKECAIFSADLFPLLDEEGLEPESTMPRRIAIVEDDAAIRANTRTRSGNTVTK